MAYELLYVGVGAALFFAFWNGFTDAANAIATIIGTRTLTPIKAVGLSAPVLAGVVVAVVLIVRAARQKKRPAGPPPGTGP